MKKLSYILCIVLLTSYAQAQEQQTFSVGNLKWNLTIPSGYQLELLANVAKPRMITRANDGALLIGSLVERVYRLPPPHQEVEIFAKLRGGNTHGVALYDNTVLVAKSDALYQIPYVPRDTPYQIKDFKKIIALPAKTGGHSSRTVKVSPDNKIYISLGISGNCSDEYIGAGYSFEKRRGGIMQLQETAPATLIPYASGLRNPVGFNWHPISKVMYASSHGPDHLGYSQPGEYFSRINPHSFHGMPWFWFDGKIMRPDTCIKTPPPRTDATLPEMTFAARNGPMDVVFVPTETATGDWENDAIVALHGSWATQPDGGFSGRRETRRPPWIARVHFENNQATKILPLIEGFQDEQGRRLARPIGLLFDKDGSLYFTSDGGEIEGLFRLRKKASY